MIGMIVLISLILVVNHVSPRLGEAAAWMLVIGFLFPLFTFGGGLVSWLVYNLLAADRSWSVQSYLVCCTCFGLPLGAVVARFILSDR